MGGGSAMLRVLLKVFVLVFTLLVLNACSSVFLGYEEENKNKIYSLDTKDCELLTKKELKYSKENVLENIKDPLYNGNYYGYQAFLCKSYKDSIKLFDLVEDGYKDKDEKNLLLKIGEGVLEGLFNDNITDYSGQYYEKMLTNTYKSMSYLALGEYDEAGVEIKRALDRQKRNKEEFESDILSELNYLQQKPRESNEVIDIINNSVPIPAYKSYANYSNPFVSYFSALYYILDGRSNNSIDLLKEVYSQENDLLFYQDYELAKNNFNTKRIANKVKKGMQISKTNKYIWVIYENGKSKSLKEFNLSLPIVFIKKNDNDIDYKIPFGNEKYSVYANQLAVSSLVFSIAILGDSSDAYPFIVANNQKTRLLSDMDKIIGAEYKATLIPRISKSFLRAITKTMISVKANKENLYSGIGVDLVNNLLNHSDIRYFIGLPKNYQAIRIANSGSINIASPNSQTLFSQELDINKHYVILVKIPTIGTEYITIFEER
ncbi:hypothetical protein AVBRAN12642_09095 [Campylobacter sp. RM12642]|uniref:hypothetical protein n=1 Tax=Campylobacter sp. RM12642 TaxID=2735736 RepID=UPI0030144C00|nr:hypothetical protein [Campylobacter sp. RM12642]